LIAVDDRAYPKFPIPGVGAIVVSSKGVLLARRDKNPAKGQWSIPGGGVEIGETQEQAIKREVLEETGVEIVVLGLHSSADVIIPDSKGEVEFHYLLNHYLARALSLETRPETPEAEVSWFTLDNLPTKEMPEAIVELLMSGKEKIAQIKNESPI
jgi:ADP-ribose pyrophosphatase YjhB (NUDIX family)